LLLAATLTSCSLHAPAQATGADAATTKSPTCAWKNEISVQTHNAGNPDNSAAYWIMPFPVREGLNITLSGHYPASRYFSVQVYQPKGGVFTVNGVSSGLADYLVQPDPGSDNPWQHRGRAGGSFTVFIRSDAAPGEPDTLPLAPAGVTTGIGHIYYRVYLPAGNDFSRLPLPVVTFALGGASKQLSPCPAAPASSSTTAAQAAPAAPAAAAGGVVFSRDPGIKSGVVANADSAYLAASVSPSGNGDVIVIRGKAPTTPGGSRPSPWPARDEDLQYWSMCVALSARPWPVVANPLPGGKTDYGCRHDTQVRLDRHGYYTLVVGTGAQRAAIAEVPGTTFLPFSAAQPTAPQTLFLRDMVASPDFAEAIQNVPLGSDPAATAAIMGPYYPLAGTCSLTVLRHQGASACIGSSP
jgi:hypothetical protein